MRKKESELYIEKKYASIQEVRDLKTPNKNEVRIYCSMYKPETEEGSVFNFQIRTHESINEFNRGKKRDMIATIWLSKAEIKQILKFVEDYKP